MSTLLASFQASAWMVESANRVTGLTASHRQNFEFLEKMPKNALIEQQN
jgi:hypothetical protein